MKCIVCNEEFEGRADAKCCSGACRAKRTRISAQPVSARDKSPEQQLLDSVNSKVDPPVMDNGVLTLRTHLPVNYGYADCECRMCQSSRAKGAQGKVINHGPWKPAGELAANEVNRVALPGDVDYVGCV